MNYIFYFYYYILHEMTEAIEKTCNFSCSCVRDDCSFKHQIELLENRKKFKEIYEKMHDKEKHRETDPDGCRLKNCFYGYLCRNKDCGFKHFCSYEGRVVITRAWNKFQKQQEAESLIPQLDELALKYSSESELVEKIKKLLQNKK